MPDIRQQAVGYVDCRMRQRAPLQGKAQFDARHRLLQQTDATRVQRFRQADFALQARKTERGKTGVPRHPDVVAATRAIAAQGASGGQLAQRGDAERERAARRIAADEVDAVTPGAGEKALAERADPGLVRRRQAAGQQGPARFSAHRGEIGHIDGERLPAQLKGVGIGKKMRSRHQHVRADRKRHPRRGL